MGSSKIMISVPEEMLSEMDREARDDHRSRSEFIREAVRHFLEFKRSHNIPRNISKIQEAVEVQEALAEGDTIEDWNGTDVIRRWRESRWR